MAACSLGAMSAREVTAQTPGERQAAVALGDEALGLFEQGNYQDAFDRFAKANELLQAPTLLLYMARCQARLGKTASAAKLYEQVASAALAPDATPQFRQAREAAVAELAELQPRVAKLTIRLTGSCLDAARLTLDGEPVATEAAGRGHPVDPGSHVAAVTAAGCQSAQATVEVKQGQAAELALRLEPEPASSAPGVPTAGDGGDGGAEGPLWPAGLAFGLGGAALGLGIVTGAMAMSQANDIKSRCVEEHCLVTDEEAGQDAQTLATIYTIGFVVGGVGLVAGVVLAVWRPGGGEDAVAAEPSLASLDVSVGPRGVSLRGAF